MAQEIYCGNNANYPGIVSGSHRAGTRHECLMKGFGVGFNQLPDSAYAGVYAPIDARRIYCGNAAVLPAGYSYAGHNYTCLAKGVGLGKGRRAQLGYDKIKLLIHLTIFLIIGGIVFACLYKFEPSFVMTTNLVNNVIDWNKFVPWYIVFVTTLMLIRYIIYFKFYV